MENVKATTASGGTRRGIIGNIHWLAFIASFAFGMFMCYITSPPKVVVHRFPNPHNLDTVYTGRFGDCYKYKGESVSCKAAPASGPKLAVRKQPVPQA